MSEEVNFISKFESTVKECWDMPAIGDYGKSIASYGQLARDIEVLRMVCDASGMKPGDRIALNGRNCYGWALIFMAATVLGYTSVLILHGSTSDTVERIVKKAGCKILFTEKATYAGMDFEAMPDLMGVVDVHTMELLAARGNRVGLYLLRERLFHAHYREGFRITDLHYEERSMDDLCCVIYTSGSTGNPKGVMLTGQNFQNYVDRIPQMFPMQRGDTHLNTLPFAHLFGLAYDTLAPLCLGQSVYILLDAPSPSVLGKALRDIHPEMLFVVPMVLNKLISSVIGRDINNIGEKAGEKVRDALGGHIKGIMSAGAAASLDMEDLMVNRLRLPYVTGYGLTECAPLITLSQTDSYVRGSCGKVLPDMDGFRIDSPDPQNIPGELQVKSKFLFAGYYLNEEATMDAFTKDGWFHTGDVGTIDAGGHVILSGRCKNMLLTSNGQNVYPEEIETILNAMPFVSESLIVQRRESFGALIVPDAEGESISGSTLEMVMNQNIAILNGKIPTYSKISWYRIEKEPFEKTPKGSIKRFIYQDKENESAR